MGLSPSILEANANMEEHVGKNANLWTDGSAMYLSIDDGTMITGYTASEHTGSGELVSISIAAVEQVVPRWILGSYTQTNYVLTIRFICQLDQIITSTTGFVLTKKSSNGEVLFESKIG